MVQNSHFQQDLLNGTYESRIFGLKFFSTPMHHGLLRSLCKKEIYNVRLILVKIKYNCFSPRQSFEAKGIVDYIWKFCSIGVIVGVLLALCWWVAYVGGCWLSDQMTCLICCRSKWNLILLFSFNIFSLSYYRSCWSLCSFMHFKDFFKIVRMCFSYYNYDSVRTQTK